MLTPSASYFGIPFPPFVAAKQENTFRNLETKRPGSQEGKTGLAPSNFRRTMLSVNSTRGDSSRTIIMKDANSGREGEKGNEKRRVTNGTEGVVAQGG